MKKCFRIASIVCFFLTGTVLLYIIVGYMRIPDEMTVGELNEMDTGNAYVFEALGTVPSEAMARTGDEYEASVRLFNIFPVKSARIKVLQRRYVVPGGDVFGIRLYTRGVMVIRVDEVTTSSGNLSPGRKAGLKEGDMIISVDGKEICRNRELSELIAASGGRPLKLLIERGGRERTISFTPVLSADSSYKGGLWIRDSTAGIGTLTWYDRTNGIFAGLGHAVCDVDTGEIMPLSGGDAVRAEVKGCYKGKNGSAGELCGVFSSGTIGKLYTNGSTGVFGVMDSFDRNAAVIPVALRREVKTGAASIICTVDENGPMYYDVEIVRVINTSSGTERNLVIKVTDERLIEKTGGIVQGMSGSPIIQNGMLAGAVTHVFVDDPLEGYGILAENMCDSAKTVESYLKAG